MRVVWASVEPVSIQWITDTLNEGRPLAYTTVMTVTERLRSKGWVGRVKQGRSYRYSALRSAEDYTAALMEQALESSSDRATALLHFAGRLGAAEAAALRKALEALPADPDAEL
ncbi:penicillinase repressor [Streptomyces poonensis]|uniref:Penicillinase repressor n=2 Tax=Streptomyces poonensis TaxID=68255 RepID=A0A918PGD3_9ACTN|nr:penicillinase repressor [Streptomyces poonensis]GLJ88491.1 penicillinase repressor [Streptomyces poonensis]